MMKDVNRTAFTATAIAHSDGGVPNIVIEADDQMCIRDRTSSDRGSGY